MFEHLFSPDYVDAEKATAEELVSAQVATADWLVEMGAPVEPNPNEAQLQQARAAFTALTTANDPLERKKHAMVLRSPEAVRHLVGMLTKYDWDFVEQAGQLRGYVVAKLLEATKDGNPQVRLKALKLLGEVTEVGAFTQRVEVTNRKVDETEVSQRLRDKLQSLLARMDAGTTDVTPRPIEADGAGKE